MALVPLFLVSCSNKKKEAPKATPQDEVKQQGDIEENPLKDAYFGELHLHTAASMDAYIAGDRLTQEDAYRWARGEDVETNGKMRRIRRPLDFAAVTDHAEFIGECYTLMYPDAPGYNDPVAQEFRNAKDLDEALSVYKKYVLDALSGSGNPHPPFYQGIETNKTMWKINQEATEKNYVPGEFTTLHAFEWSSAPETANLHRNVIFRDTKLPEVPYSANDSKDPEDLWAWMQKQADQGMTLLCNPHNSNESKGKEFAETTLSGKPITKEYAQLRQKFDRNIEMMQIKGNSEVNPKFWPNDEFADFEVANSIQKYNGRTFMKINYVRYGLDRGILFNEQIGVNPYKYGIVGGTDSHNGTMSNVEEDNWDGGHGKVDNTAEKRANGQLRGELDCVDETTGSITGVWATSNTRPAIYDGIHNKETFATSGPRMKVRFWAGQGFKGDYSSYEEMVKDGYAKGVPMGQDMKKHNAPEFLVWAIKDPMAPNLDRIQIIKGWVENGEMKDRVFNVAASGDRLQPNGSVTPIDAPINLETGAFNEDKGDQELMTVWKDPEFDPKQQAYYYVRVLQLPTARWNLFDEIREGVKFPDGTKKEIVERAWSSPIWYEPK